MFKRKILTTLAHLQSLPVNTKSLNVREFFTTPHTHGATSMAEAGKSLGVIP
jgi:hypothetical protein